MTAAGTKGGQALGPAFPEDLRRRLDVLDLLSAAEVKALVRGYIPRSHYTAVRMRGVIRAVGGRT